MTRTHLIAGVFFVSLTFVGLLALAAPCRSEAELQAAVENAATGASVASSFASVKTQGFMEDGVNGCIVRDENPFCEDRYGSLAVKGGSGRDAGRLLGWMTASARDLGGHVRVKNGAVDFGCYEFQPVPGFMLLLSSLWQGGL